MTDKKTKVLIAVICILAAICAKLYLELQDYKDLPKFLPFNNNPVFIKYALEKDITTIGEYQQWITEVELQQHWEREISLDPIYQKYTWELCQMFDVDYNLILAVMYHESRFKIDAYSKTNDIGLMQVNRGNRAWANELAGRKIDLYDPYDNILTGILIYKHYEDYWLDRGIEGEKLPKYTLNSYNMGISGFASAGYPVNRSYSRNILSTMEEMN